jgi:hydrogenase maturation protease
VNDAGVLIVGYGNPLRSDDGFGWHAARLLAADPRLAGARVLTLHQLTPELAADIASASLVVLVDASVVDAAPGSVAVRSIQPRQDSPLSWSHHLDPAALAGLAHALYDHVPPTAWPALPSPTATGSHPPSSGCSPRSSTGSPEW